MFRRSRKAQAALRRLVESGDVPTFPTVVGDAIQQIAQPDVDLGHVAETISADPRLTVAVLKLANSPSFAPRSPITSVHQAAVLLGRNQLESLLIATGVSDVVPTEGTAGYSPKAFWLESSARAAAAAAMAAVCEPSKQYEQFTSALLQDLAQPILMHHDSTYAAIVNAHAGPHAWLVEVEGAALGWTHPEVGGLLADNWGLPDRLAIAISEHHGGAQDGNEVAQWASLVSVQNPDIELLTNDARDRLGVDGDVVEATVAHALERATELAAVFA